MCSFLFRVIRLVSSKKERPTVTTGSTSIVFVFNTRDILTPPLLVFCSTYEPVCYHVNDFAAMIVGFNSSPPNAAYMRQWVGPALVQIMACQNTNQNTKLFFHENATENIVWKITAILCRPQCVKSKTWSNGHRLGCGDKTMCHMLHVFFFFLTKANYLIKTSAFALVTFQLQKAV